MNKLLNKIIWPVMAAPAIYLALVWNKIPVRVAMHFNLSGTPDRYGNKSELQIMVAVLMAVNIGLYLLLSNAYRIDAKRPGKENKDRLERMAFAVSVFITCLTCYLIYNCIKGGGSPFSIRLVFGSIGLMWCIMGNYMYNIRPNYFAGFRTKWALNNEENWKKTHLLAGKLWFTGGLLLAIVCLFSSEKGAVIIFLFVTLVTTIIPGIYSYRLYKKQKVLNSVN
ncbi:MAG: SdpI family protein [Bacteroidota bacterium]|nr:SdpI family protein [Bacteroidota bacterium]